MTIKEQIEQQRTYFESGETKNVDFRLQCLKKLRANMLNMQQELYDALQTDLGKCATESYMSEVGMVLAELNHTIRHLKHWATPKHVHTPIAQFPSKSFVSYEPLGVTLIIAPWNYPFLLSMDPLVGAIAAGNTVILKPSKEAPHICQAMQKLIQSTFLPQHVFVVPGGEDPKREILNCKYDHIFFTGGVEVGKKVAHAAADNLCRATLELGGKSPCIVDHTAPLDVAARRLVWGKFLNCGQTCVAPDYLLVEDCIKEQFLKHVKAQIETMFGKTPLTNPDYGKMINKKQFDRVCGLIDNKKVIFGGTSDAESLKISPTIMDNVSLVDPIMQEEIFGPVLPVLSYSTLNEAIDIIGHFEKPLALYLFSKNKKIQKQVLARVSFGGGCIGDTIIHIASTHMGFGGVGNSGNGRYHGKESFAVFSNARSIVHKKYWLDLPLRYQPFSKLKDKLIRMFMR